MMIAILSRVEARMAKAGHSRHGRQLHCRKALRIAYLAVRAVAAIALATSIRANAEQRTAPLPISISFQLDHGVIVVPVSLNGRAPRFLMVDTGATVDVLLDSRTATELGLRHCSPPKHLPPAISPSAKNIGWVSLTSTMIIGAGGRRIEIPDGGKAPVLDIGGLPSSIEGKPIAGIVGNQFLARHIVTLDFDRNLLSIRPSGAQPVTGSHAHMAQLTERDEYGNYYLHGTANEEYPLYMVLDTGSPVSTLTPAAVRSMRPTRYGSLLVGNVVSWSLEPIVPVKSIALGGIDMGECEIGCCMPISDQVGTVGLDLLSRFRLTLDLGHSRIWLEPRAHAHIRVSGYSGIALADEAGRFIVRYVDPRSPASAAGVTDGDTLLALNGTPVGKRSVSTIAIELDSEAGRTTSLTVRRGSRNLHVTFVLDRSVAEPRAAIDGLVLNVAGDQPMTVIDVLHDCAGERGGLVAGDQILSINGITTAGSKPEQFAVLMALPVLKLKIRRAGTGALFDVDLHVH